MAVKKLCDEFDVLRMALAGCEKTALELRLRLVNHPDNPYRPLPEKTKGSAPAEHARVVSDATRKRMSTIRKEWWAKRRKAESETKPKRQSRRKK